MTLRDVAVLFEPFDDPGFWTPWRRDRLAAADSLLDEVPFCPTGSSSGGTWRTSGSR